jgi:glycosyltransferase involved in cell wall biosynthesis
MNAANEPLVSIITVIYNDVKNIEQTITSVLKQTYFNLEYIIIDGGSNDGTVDIIKKYEKYLKYWISEKDKGIYDAMNKGLCFANGEWINFMNSGDIFYSDNVVNKVFHDIALSNAKIIYGDTEIRFQNKAYIKKGKKWQYIWMDFVHQSFFIKKSEMPFFNLEYQISSDFNLIYSLYKANVNVLKLDIVISSYLTGGISYKYATKGIKETIVIVSKQFELFPFLYRIYAYIKYSIILKKL